MIRDKVTPTELDLLIYLAEPRTIEDVMHFMGVERQSVYVSICRMRKKNLITNEGTKKIPLYKASKSGESILFNLLDMLSELKFSY